MKTKTLYTCEVCHTDYANKVDALECEHSHSKIDLVKDFRYIPKAKLPNKIEIKFADGTTHWYRAQVKKEK
ncbi:hypothetical protein [Agathobacter rectalis]|uniref:hypothetical protein n=1 Tax=Agathobacter rectalis TaxID=39491 RepID=UPI0027D208C3|nr:hypothetical protein [Agathobacter rectalis]MCB7108766.1 hypothetical protein [Agathobacter rectalis]MCG4812059.1 hypothetical protein [Agathobacter rectalis]